MRISVLIGRAWGAARIEITSRDFIPLLISLYTVRDAFF
jgi:hypothetical protein